MEISLPQPPCGGQIGYCLNKFKFQIMHTELS
jgi:hypothetical protein